MHEIFLNATIGNNLVTYRTCIKNILEWKDDYINELNNCLVLKIWTEEKPYYIEDRSNTKIWLPLFIFNTLYILQFWIKIHDPHETKLWENVVRSLVWEVFGKSRFKRHFIDWRGKLGHLEYLTK